MGNPHLVVALPTVDDLAALDLSSPPAVQPALPGGQNVEFVVRTGPREITMRVHERGVGETRSCGTGICAAVVATIGMASEPGDDGRDVPWTVRVPGGQASVTWSAAGPVLLTGPAVLVADGEVLLGRPGVSVRW